MDSGTAGRLPCGADAGHSETQQLPGAAFDEHLPTVPEEQIPIVAFAEDFPVCGESFTMRFQHPNRTGYRIRFQTRTPVRKFVDQLLLGEPFPPERFHEIQGEGGYGGALPVEPAVTVLAVPPGVSDGRILDGLLAVRADHGMSGGLMISPAS